MTLSKIELTIETTQPFYTNAPSWYQVQLIIGDTKQPLGREFFDYDDCRLFAEKLVEDFSKAGMCILHSKIYDLM